MNRSSDDLSKLLNAADEHFAEPVVNCDADEIRASAAKTRAARSRVWYTALAVISCLAVYVATDGPGQERRLTERSNSEPGIADVQLVSFQSVVDQSREDDAVESLKRELARMKQEIHAMKLRREELRDAKRKSEFDALVTLAFITKNADDANDLSAEQVEQIESYAVFFPDSVVGQEASEWTVGN